MSGSESVTGEKTPASPYSAEVGQPAVSGTSAALVAAGAGAGGGRVVAEDRHGPPDRARGPRREGDEGVDGGLVAVGLGVVGAEEQRVADDAELDDLEAEVEALLAAVAVGDQRRARCGGPDVVDLVGAAHVLDPAGGVGVEQAVEGLAGAGGVGVQRHDAGAEVLRLPGVRRPGEVRDGGGHLARPGHLLAEPDLRPGRAVGDLDGAGVVAVGGGQAGGEGEAVGQLGGGPGRHRGRGGRRRRGRHRGRLGGRLGGRGGRAGGALVAAAGEQHPEDRQRGQGGAGEEAGARGARHAWETASRAQKLS